ncbi:hypothetical protein [Lunatimonas salinarum]|uniref:hypothetical protein n=1 Tax=Lunatimonas salinarum TaxID=1774590 RepID=UPI001ADF2786|nr:hypothetical protein [Lunatimonas salinarum]
MFKRILLAGFWLSVSSGCGFITISKSGGSAERYADYREDLSTTRKSFDALPTTVETVRKTGAAVAPVDDDLAIANQNYIKTNESENFFSGFTILVYSGVDREEAFKTRNDLYSAHKEITTFMQYQQPRYLVKVGRYINRIEALAWYEKIKVDFPSARIIQDRFERNLPEQPQDTLENAQEQD